MIPNFVGAIEALTHKYPSAWEKCKHPGDDGEFNAWVCWELNAQHPQVGRNGKRGDPRNLSLDVINWSGEGNNVDPTNGNAPCTIIDFISGHQSASAAIVQLYPDPSGPGAWVLPVKPLPSVPPAPIYPPYPGDAVFDQVGLVLFGDYARAGQAYDGDGDENQLRGKHYSPNAQMGRWFGRVIYDWLAGVCPTLEASITKHRAEWCAILGVPV